MKKLMVIVVVAAVSFYLYTGGGSDFVVPQQTMSQRSAAGIKPIEFSTLFNQKKSFPALAHENYYTVIEVYLDSCSVCRRLESGFKPFLEQRRDVIIKKVHFPESGMNFTITSEQEAAEIQARIDSYQVCGTPHVEIYGPDQQIIAKDNCASKAGTQFLRRWIGAETGILWHTL